jgi:uncharacterized protein YjbI with pentapeptide repeats
VLARLQGASFQDARLQGASFQDAQLQGASFGRVQLQGASLAGAQLQGASLDHAQLHGAVLVQAQLQGASLSQAQLQGANFTGSTFAGTDMRNAEVWRTNFEGASLTAGFEDGVKEGAIKILNPDIFGPEASEQETLEKGRVDETAYKKSLADQLKGLACSGDKDALYIVRGLIENKRIKDTGAQAPGLIEAILKPERHGRASSRPHRSDPQECPVSAVLTEADKAALKKLAKVVSGAH